MTLRFGADGRFRVLQVADFQDGPDASPDAVELIEAALHRAHPDLVVFTGDQIRGYDPAFATTFLSRRGDEPGDMVRATTRVEMALGHVRKLAAGLRPKRGDDVDKGNVRAGDVARNDDAAGTGTESSWNTATDDSDEATMTPMDVTRSRVMRTLTAMLGPVVRMRIPFAVTYGNHDFQCGLLTDEQDDMYRRFTGCLNPPAGSGPLALEPGTFCLPVRASKSGRTAMAVTLVDSGDYEESRSAAEESGDAEGDARRHGLGRHRLDLADASGYGAPSPTAVRWLFDAQRILRAGNGDGRPVPVMAFQHIPPQEFYDCLRAVPFWTPNAVEGHGPFAGRCFALDTDVCRPGSRLGEGVSCSAGNVGEVEAMRHAGGYFGLFCGHDHRNAFIGHVHGLDLGYTPTCGFASYGPAARLRGVRVFDFPESDPASYETRLLTWGELIGRRPRRAVWAFLGDHGFADLPGLRDELKRPASFAAATGAMLALMATKAACGGRRRH